MQFTVQLPGGVDQARLTQLFAHVDPSSVLDLDPAGVLRIAAVIDEHAIAASLRELDLPVSASDVRRLPSECCGGCGG